MMDSGSEAVRQTVPFSRKLPDRIIGKFIL